MTIEEIKTATEEIISYFADSEVVLPESFDLQKCADGIGVPIEHAHVLLCNLEDTSVMKEIADGYYGLDIEDESIFNDCYHDMMEDLGYEESEDEEE